jgi:hypothetical protein
LRYINNEFDYIRAVKNYNAMRFKVLFFILLTTAAWAQSPNNKAISTEWDQLDQAFIAVIDALRNNDKAAFTALCLPGVDCIDCVGKPEFNEEGNFVTPAIFFLNIAQNFTNSPVYKAMVKRGYTFSTIILKGFKPKVVPADSPEDLKLYEVWIPTYKVDELSKGHPGTSHAFQFVKINGKFKFYGLTSIP